MGTIVNLDFITGFSKGNMERVRKYVQMFLEASAEGMPAIEQSFAAQDWKRLKTAAHTLKSISGYMGMTDTQNLLKQMEENAAMEQDLENMPEDITKLQQHLRQAEEELNNFLAQN
ncbi:MAG: Hpt domain-containing protein [Bacteroidetes bacterium]|jgi:HPt (histidine-containing phosphotransfer) domain-containing protein|nr:Hpt domain-containing protein [Bacteroidota bacterium]